MGENYSLQSLTSICLVREPIMMFTESLAHIL